MGWNDRPQAGEVWRKGGRRPERRTVVDRNLGGDVFYKTGGPLRYRYRGGIRCSVAEWFEWQKGAAQIKED